MMIRIFQRLIWTSMTCFWTRPLLLLLILVSVYYLLEQNEAASILMLPLCMMRQQNVLNASSTYVAVHGLPNVCVMAIDHHFPEIRSRPNHMVASLWLKGLMVLNLTPELSQVLVVMLAGVKLTRALS
jgi:hypothetical protein